jgi:hypothetical protein
MVSGGISSEALKMEEKLRASLALARAHHVAKVHTALAEELADELARVRAQNLAEVARKRAKKGSSLLRLLRRGPSWIEFDRGLAV